MGNQAAGMYYDDYGENPIVQYVEAQSWDVENGGISADGTGNKIDLEFIVPVGGSEADNFNTMMATGEYSELVTTAFAANDMVDSSDAYCYSIFYEGYTPLGNFNSSFGGGNGSYYVKDGKVLYDGNSEYMETYIECVREWYDKGWLDQNFEQRTDAPAFFMINPNSEAQGKVGMWNSFVSGLGKGGSSAITDEAEKESFYAMPAPLPLNDKYGSEHAQFVEPIVSYQDSRVSSPVVCTTKCQDHSEEELATLFTCFDWTYSREGGLVTQLGLTKEQYESIDFTYDMYEAVGLTEGAYTTTTDEEGNTVYVMNYDDSMDWASYVQGEGMAVGCRIVGGGDTDYTVQRPNTGVVALAYEYWSFYPDKGSLLTLPTLFTSEESETKSKLDTRLNEYIDVNLPKVVKGDMSWDDYKDGLGQFQDSIDEVCEIMQGHLE